MPQSFWAWIRQGRPYAPALGLVLALGLVALATPLPKPSAVGGTAAQESTDATGAAAGTTSTGTTTAGAGARGAQGALTGGPAGSAAGGAALSPGAPGSAGGPAGTPSGAATGSTYPGVTATTVKWGYSAQDKGCGGFDQSAAAQAYGGSSTPAVDYPAAEEYFNKHPLENVTLPPEIRAHVNAKNGYWGRRIISVFRDSGGFACPDVGRANAVTMAEQDKVFGLVMRGNEGPEVPMSLVMAQHRRVFIGRQNVGPRWFRTRAPYFWDGMWGEGESEMAALGSWVCRDWAGKKATDTGDPTVSGKARKYGIPYPDQPDFAELAVILQKEIRRCGLSGKPYPYPVDLQTLETEAQTVVTKMHQDQVTTALMITDWLTPIFLSQAATQQNWHPEWVRSGWGAGSYGNTYRLLTADQSKNNWVAADAASIATPAYHDSEAYKAWKTVRPNAEPDGDWPSYYYQMKVMALGMAGAGPNLTPETFGQGLARVCNPCHRSNPLLPLERLGPGHWTNREGFTLVRFNPDKPDPTAPPDSSGKQPVGYFDFLENGKRYGRRITDREAT